MVILSNGHYCASLENKKNSKGSVAPVKLDDIKILNDGILDLKNDFIEFLTDYRKRTKANHDDWRQDFFDTFGYDIYDDYWGDDYMYYPKHNNNKPKKALKLKPTRFINDIEVDSDVTDDEINNILNEGNITKHHKKRKRHKSKRKKDFDDWLSMFDDEDLLDPGSDVQFDRYNEINQDNKRFIVYRALNNTADTYEFNSINEFSDWLAENEITVSDYYSYELMYNDVSHCFHYGGELYVASSYEELVFRLTGGDVDEFEEISSMGITI